MIPTLRTLQQLAAVSGVLADVRVFPARTREERRLTALHIVITTPLRAQRESTRIE